MNVVWNQIKNGLHGIGGHCTRLLGNHSHRVALIDQSELALRVALGRGIDVDASFEQIAVEIGRQRANVARGVGSIGSGVVLLTILDVALHPQWEFLVVALVNGVYLACLGRTYGGVRKTELPYRRIERKTVHAVARGVDQHCRRAIRNIACRNHLTALLQKVLDTRSATHRREATVDRENGAQRNIYVDVRRAVQRIDADDVFGFVAQSSLKTMTSSFSSEAMPQHSPLARNSSMKCCCIEVELLLLFTLNVDRPHTADDVDQACFVDLAIDLFGCNADVEQNARKFTLGAGMSCCWLTINWLSVTIFP